uniref:anthrax toxin receptor-like n=1 Tax=Ictidomys tridecemlineatus TaxID=43179 RepID=UPI001A9DE470|nr:anthrax toxin receptor-like [Ictidomys tridecemlineatus]XP_040129361.1 anthrax toxin receptor-like [Ictidomys tridecemlineatus]
MIIAMTDGRLLPNVFEETKELANKSRSMGATVYTVGVLDYQKNQMIAVADSPKHMFGVDTGFANLKTVVEPLSSKTCIEVTSVEASDRCAGASYDVFITGQGFHNARRKDQIICRFKFKDKTIVDKKPKDSNDTSITCPGAEIKQPDEEVFVEVSLNNGESFLGNKHSINSTKCGGGQSPPVNTENTVTVIEKKTYDLGFLAWLPLLLLIPLLLYCCWKLCLTDIMKPPPQKVRAGLNQDFVTYLRTTLTFKRGIRKPVPWSSTYLGKDNGNRGSKRALGRTLTRLISPIQLPSRHPEILNHESVLQK